MVQHFLKTFILFTGMILMGLLGVFLVSHFGIGDGIEENTAKVAK